MKKYQAALFVSFAIFLASCSSTPKIHLNTGDMTMEVKSKVPDISAMSYSPDGNSVISGGWDNTIRLWDLAGARERMKFKGRLSPIGGLAFSPDGTMIAATSGGDSRFADRASTIWDVASGKVIKEFPGKGFAFFPDPIQFSPDNKYILGSFNSYVTLSDVLATLKLGDVQSGTVIREFSDYYGGLISPDGKYIIAKVAQTENILIGPVYFIRLLDFKTGKEIWSYASGKESIGAMAFSPNGKQILAVYNLSSGPAARITHNYKLFDTMTGSIIREFSGLEEPLFLNFGKALAFSPDGKFAMSGSSISHYKLWDISTGTMVRKMKTFDDESAHLTVPFTPAVAFSPNGKTVVVTTPAAVRLFDISTGDELASMIAFKDGEWLVITSNGYYNSSEKGDQYLSVKVGGKDYTIAQLRESFYRPDLVKVAISGGSLKEFKKMADIKQPPAVAIVDTPKSIDKDEAAVTLKITDTGGGIGDIRLYLNGSAIVLDSTRDLNIVPTKDDKLLYKKYTVKLTNGLNTIRAIVFNGDNTMQSTDAIFEITASSKSITRPSLYALIIGINEYKNPKLELKYAVADAELFGDTINKMASPLFEKIVIKRLTTKDDTEKENIIKELKAAHSLNPDDLFVFYVASHGTVDDGEYFLITSNIGSTSTAKLKTDAIPQNTLKGLIANIPTTKKLIVIDTCSAGALGDAIQTAMLTRGMNEDTAMKVLSRAVGSTILSASTSVQQAIEGYQGHGLFTYVIAEGLTGKADSDKDGFVKTTEIANYVDDEVPALAERVFKKAQYPTVTPSGMGFPIGKVK